MTNRERLISLLGFAPDKNSVDGALIDADITGADNYTGSNSDELKTLAISILELLLSTPDITNTDGSGFVHATKYDRTAILKRIDLLKEELGLFAGPVITAPKVW